MREPDTWTSGRVTRWHSHPVMNQHRQTNADHQWGVAALCLVLHPDPSLALLRACLLHDCGEIGPGDVSYPAKQKNAELRRAVNASEREAYFSMGLPAIPLDKHDLDWLEMLDRLESIRFVGLREPQILEDDEWQGVLHGIMSAAQTFGVEDTVMEVLAG